MRGCPCDSVRRCPRWAAFECSARCCPLWRVSARFPLRLLSNLFLPRCRRTSRPPNAGQILQEVTPPQPPPGTQRPDVKLPAAPARPRAVIPEGGPKLVVKEVGFKGNTVFSDAQLRALIAPLLAKPVGGARVAARRIQGNRVLPESGLLPGAGLFRASGRHHRAARAVDPRGKARQAAHREGARGAGTRSARGRAAAQHQAGATAAAERPRARHAPARRHARDYGAGQSGSGRRARYHRSDHRDQQGTQVASQRLCRQLGDLLYRLLSPRRHVPVAESAGSGRRARHQPVDHFRRGSPVRCDQL